MCRVCRVIYHSVDNYLHVRFSLQWTGDHGGIVTCCDFSRDGKLVVSGSDLDHTIKIWDANTGEELQVISGE